MTSTPVTDALGVGMITSKTAQSQPNGKTAAAQFDTFMNQAKAQTTDAKAEVKKPEKADDSKEDVKLEKAAATKDTRTVSKQEGNEKTVTEDNVDTVKKAVDSVKDEIKEELSVTDEEIEAVLEELGLNLLSLLNPETLPIIVTKLTNEESPLSLALNEDLYESLQKLEATVETTVENLAKELEIPVEEFESALKSAISESGKVENDEIIATSDDINTSDKEIKKPLEERITFSRFERANVGGKTDEIITEVKTDTAWDNEERHESFEGNKSNQNSGLLSFAENLIAKVTEAFNEENSTVSYSFNDVKNVMDQITESIKINITNESSEISLKLHPESLGSVSVKVSANNEGAMTARFIAQNESVKAIIESQAVVLKETLEAKGVTVEAVEVMVQSHEFERNLSDSERKSEEEGKSKKKGLRRIDLSTEEEAETSEDSLVREMMAQSGNTIDYSA